MAPERSSIEPVVAFRNEGPSAGERYALGDPLRRVGVVIAVGLSPVAMLDFAAAVSQDLVSDMIDRSWPPSEEPFRVGDVLLVAGRLYVRESSAFVPLATHLARAGG